LKKEGKGIYTVLSFCFFQGFDAFFCSSVAPYELANGSVSFQEATRPGFDSLAWAGEMPDSNRDNKYRYKGINIFRRGRTMAK
jgi:hypothetical protein